MSRAQRVVIADLSELQGVVGDIELTVDDCNSILSESVVSLVEEEQQKHFENRATPGGTPWEPWHWRPIGAPRDHPTLEISGDLRRSMMAGQPGNRADVDAGELEFGSTLDYAGLQNFGGETVLEQDMINRGMNRIRSAGTTMTIPAREFAGFSEESVDGIAESVAAAVVEKLKGGERV